MIQLLKKIGIAICIMGIYIFFIRDYRHNLSKASLNIAQNNLTVQDNISMYRVGNTNWFVEKGDDGKIFKFRFPFGLFYLMTNIGLIFIGYRVRYLLVLTVIHGVTVGIYWTIIAFLPQSFLFLIIVDLISRYLIQVFSLGLVALAYLKEKAMKRVEHE